MWNAFKSDLVFTFILMLLLWLSNIIWDDSWDGTWYHACSIYMLSWKGYNPFYDHLFFNDISVGGWLTDLWVNHYGKSVEITMAPFCAVFGNMEYGKCVNLLFIVSSLFYVLRCLNTIIPKKSNFHRLFLTTAIVFNPVVITQMFTMYIDWVCYISIIISLCCLFFIYKEKSKKDLLVLVLLCLWIPGVKFNILFWFVVFNFLFLFFYVEFNYSFKKRILLICSISVLFGLFVGAYNPYVTNFIKKGNPLYPLAGKEKVDIMQINSHPLIDNHNIFYSVNFSLIVNPQNSKRPDYTILIPNWTNIKDSGLCDVRLGGFGIFFFESILISIIIIVLLLKFRSYTKGTLKICVILLLLYLCLFILPSGWWARYVPFFYLFPLLVVLFSYMYFNDKIIIVVLSRIILFLLLFDILISAFSTSLYAYRYKKDMVQIVGILDKYGNSGKVIRLKTANTNFLSKLDNKNINYINKEKLCRCDTIYLGTTIYVENGILEKEYEPTYLDEKILFPIHFYTN